MVHEYNAIVTKVIDGDTFDVNIDLGFNIWIDKRVRLYGVDTPEIRGVEKEFGKHVKEYVDDLLFMREVILTTHKLSGKYGRYIAKVKVEKIGDLSQHLIKNGLAREVDYD